MDKELAKKCIRTYSSGRIDSSNTNSKANQMETNIKSEVTREPLKTKRAVELLLSGNLKKKVCRYCLNITSPLSELDQIMQISNKGTLYKVTIRDMIASFHPYKVIDDPNIPNKICEKCLNRTLSSYLFAQQCEQSERALRNCLDDISEKLEKLDPLERPKKRGRQKQNPNYNVIYTEHNKVIDYAQPIINIINTDTVRISEENPEINNLECPKCWQVLPNMELLLNHEKIHPSSMWYSCRLCGKSFVKHNQLKRHIKSTHALGKELTLPSNKSTDFRCFDCGANNVNYNSHLLHIEKHKFKMVLEHLVERKMDKLCTVCLKKDVAMVDLDNMVCLHGGFPSLNGDRSLYNILGSILPDMNFLQNHTGTKICKTCLNHAVTSYVFINHTHYIRCRLNTCISQMLDNLNQIEEPEGNIFVEISQSTVLPVKDQDVIDEELLLGENDEIDESKLKVDVLEDEFRVRSDSEESSIESEVNSASVNTYNNNIVPHINVQVEIPETIDNPAKKVTKTYMNKKLVNGYQTNLVSDVEETKYNSLDDVCSEFLTFKKKRKPTKRFYKYKYNCPMCNKNFISDYYLKRHVLKHVSKKVHCAMCGNQFKSKFFLHEHVKMVHLQKQTDFNSCRICGRTFTNIEKMQLHVKTHISKECQLCGKIFKSQKHYDSHMQRHAVKLNVMKRKRVQTCSFCEKECANDNKLSLHVNKVHLQIKPYGCDMCDKQFYTESNLSKHRKVHSLFSKETCEFCNKVLKSRRGLVLHVRKHIGVKPHQCQICGKSFYSDLKVKHHMNVYHGGRFFCKLCKTVFVNKSELKDHVNVAHAF